MAFDPLTTPIDKVLLAYDPPSGQTVTWQRSPGIAKVTGAALLYRWDKRQGYGLAGAFPVYFGEDLPDFVIELRLYTSQDWVDWAAWKPLVVKPPKSIRPKALAIYHPWLAEVQIGACTIKKVHQPEPDDETGGFLIAIECMKWRKPTIALSKPDAAKTNASDDPVDQEIERRTKLLEQLAKE